MSTHNHKTLQDPQTDATHEEEGLDSFFRSASDSTPPVVETLIPEDDEELRIEPESPQVLARRARFRRAVAMFVAASGLFAITAVARTAVARRSVSSQESQSTHVAARPVLARCAKQLVVPIVVAAPPAAPAKPAINYEEEQNDPKPDPVEGARLRKEATALMDRGKFRDAIKIAEAATVADPAHATSWLLLGSALQSAGQYKEGANAYNRCVQMAAKGPIWECRAMGGR